MRNNLPQAPRNPVSRKRFALSKLNLKGHGTVILHLKGSGHLEIWRGRGDHFEFDGRGLPRHLSSTHLRMAAGEGRVTLTGSDLRVCFSGGCLDLEVDGCFQQNAPARGTLKAPRAARPGPHRRIQWDLVAPPPVAWCSEPS